MVKEVQPTNQDEQRQPQLFSIGQLSSNDNPVKTHRKKSPVTSQLSDIPSLHQATLTGEIESIFIKKIKIHPIDRVAQIREPKLSIGEINISVNEIIEALGFETFHYQAQLELAFSYLLLLQDKVNRGKIENTPQSLCATLLEIGQITLFDSPDISPPNIEPENETERFADVSLEVQALCMNALLNGPFRHFEPTKTFPQITFSELYDIYTVWLRILTNFTFDPTPPSISDFQRQTERGIAMHELDMYLDAVRSLENPQSCPFPTNTHFSLEFAEIASAVPFEPTIPEYLEVGEMIISRMQARGETQARQLPHQYSIWKDDPEEVLQSLRLLSNHWAFQEFQTPICNTHIYREVGTRIRLGGLPVSNHPLGISIFTCFDKIHSYIPTGILEFQGQVPLFTMSDLKFKEHLGSESPDPFKREVERRSNEMLRYIAQAFLGSNQVKDRLLIAAPVDKKGYSQAYNLHSNFLTTPHQSLKTELTVFNPITGDVSSKQIELGQDEIDWLNAWLTQIFIPFVHLYDSIGRDVNRLYNMVS